MTESKHSLNELPALMDERRKFESWLAALEARRDATPAHVFDRVKGDYLTRLQRVEEQLVAHRQAIEEERAHSQSRLSALTADEQQRRDERAELELRSHVGELEGPAAETAFQTIDSTLRRLLDEEKSVNDRIAELNALLNFKSVEKTPPEPVIVMATAPVAQPPAAPAQPAAPATDGNRAGRITPGGTFDELAFLSEVVGEEERRAAQSARPDRVVPPVAAPAKSANSASLGSAAAAHPPEAPAPATAGLNAAPPSPPPQPQPVAAPAAPASRPAAPVAAAIAAHAAAEIENNGDTREPLIPRRPSFARKDESEQSLLDGLEGAPRRGALSRDIPLAANVASNTPIVLKATGAVEQSKTLKCTECGAMNYPTEWYCERCGAELAAL